MSKYKFWSVKSQQYNLLEVDLFFSRMAGWRDFELAYCLTFGQGSCCCWIPGNSFTLIVCACHESGPRRHKMNFMWLFYSLEVSYKKRALVCMLYINETNWKVILRQIDRSAEKTKIRFISISSLSLALALSHSVCVCVMINDCDPCLSVVT